MAGPWQAWATEEGDGMTPVLPDLDCERKQAMWLTTEDAIELRERLKRERGRAEQAEDALREIYGVLIREGIADS